ncbi:hypothetical protein QE152_g36606 [Popillia japonica]|uniref:Transposable element P transposase-like RNase H C-terminal domain-containing protein n=1 Tax=Popillia japonica TaxID=7064 RepID=A0AAW1ICT4_POPJA
MDKIFDLLNSTTLSISSSKQYIQPFTGKDYQIEFVTDMRKMFANMQFLITLVTMSPKDSLENFFGCVRPQCGNVRNPTPVQRAFKKLFSLNYLHYIEGGNCAEDFEVILNQIETPTESQILFDTPIFEKKNEFYLDTRDYKTLDFPGRNALSGLVLGLRGMKNFYEIKSGSEKECITALSTISADGQIHPPMIVYPYERIPAEIVQNTNPDWVIEENKNQMVREENDNIETEESNIIATEGGIDNTETEIEINTSRDSKRDMDNTGTENVAEFTKAGEDNNVSDTDNEHFEAAKKDSNKLFERPMTPEPTTSNTNQKCQNKRITNIKMYLQKFP